MRIASHPAIDRWLRSSIVIQAEKHLGVHLQMGKLERNFTLTRITLNDVTLRDLEGSGNSISVSRLVVNIDPYAFFRGKVVVRDLKLEGMFLDIVRREDGTVAVDPLFPFWQTREQPRRKMARLGFEIENVAFLDVDLSFHDVPAGARVELENVTIFLNRNRFDPPDRRTFSIGAKEGSLVWRVFPEGRIVSINSLSGNFAVTPDELKVVELDLDTGPLALTLSGTLPFVRDAELNGNLSVDLDIGSMPWLIPDSEGRVTLNGNVGGELSSPSFRGQLIGVDVRAAGRTMNRISADIFLNPDGCTLSAGRIDYRGAQLITEADLLFKKKLPFNMNLRTERYPLYKILEEVGGKTSPGEGHVSADLMISGYLSGGSSVVTMGGDMAVPLGGELRSMDFLPMSRKAPRPCPLKHWSPF